MFGFGCRRLTATRRPRAEPRAAGRRRPDRRRRPARYDRVRVRRRSQPAGHLAPPGGARAGGPGDHAAGRSALDERPSAGVHLNRRMPAPTARGVMLAEGIPAMLQLRAWLLAERAAEGDPPAARGRRIAHRRHLPPGRPGTGQRRRRLEGHDRPPPGRRGRGHGRVHRVSRQVRFPLPQPGARGHGDDGQLRGRLPRGLLYFESTGTMSIRLPRPSKSTGLQVNSGMSRARAVAAMRRSIALRPLAFLPFAITAA
jgi:hypothetical protein